MTQQRAFCFHLLSTLALQIIFLWLQLKIKRVIICAQWICGFDFKPCFPNCTVARETRIPFRVGADVSTLIADWVRDFPLFPNSISVNKWNYSNKSVLLLWKSLIFTCFHSMLLPWVASRACVGVSRKTQTWIWNTVHLSSAKPSFSSCFVNACVFSVYARKVSCRDHHCVGYIYILLDAFFANDSQLLSRCELKTLSSTWSLVSWKKAVTWTRIFLLNHG